MNRLRRSGSGLLGAGLFLALGGILWLGLEKVSRAHPPQGWDLILLQRMDTVRRAPESIRILAIGNSHAGAIAPEALEPGSLILPFPWNDLADVNHQLRTLVPRLPQLQVVLITVSYFTLHWSNDALGDEGLLDSRRKFHAVAPGWKPVEGDVESLVQGKTYWIARPDHWLGVFSGIRGSPMELDDLGEHLEEFRTDSFLVAHAEDRVPHTLDQAREMLELDPVLPEANQARLVDLLAYLDEEGVCVVLYTPPFHWRYRELYGDAPSLEEMNRRIRRISAKTGVPWLDHSDHPMSGDARWFVDSDHLNNEGRARFTDLIMDEVAERCPSGS
jgi:hypothetical protein